MPSMTISIIIHIYDILVLTLQLVFIFKSTMFMKKKIDHYFKLVSICFNFKNVINFNWYQHVFKIMIIYIWYLKKN